VLGQRVAVYLGISIGTFKFLSVLVVTYGADEVGHSGASGGITTLQEPSNTCGICNTLDRELTCSTNAAGDLVEEQGADSCSIADVALLASATGVDHADGTACGTVGELIIAAAAVLTLGESVLLGTKVAGQKLLDGEGFCVCSGRRGCKSASEERNGQECELHVG
jgi:hypothetical protein